MDTNKKIAANKKFAAIFLFCQSLVSGDYFSPQKYFTVHINKLEIYVANIVQ
jgi:hypothetical protein